MEFIFQVRKASDNAEWKECIFDEILEWQILWLSFELDFSAYRSCVHMWLQAFLLHEQLQLYISKIRDSSLKLLPAQ